MQETASVAATPSTPGVDALSWVSAIAPYVAGKPIEETARELGLDPARIVKVASNENPLGMAPAAVRALERLMRSPAAELGRYPDSNGFALRAALAERFGVPADWITLGNGSNDILELCAAATLAPGRSGLYAQYSFAVYPLAVQARGARAIVVPAKAYGHDLDAMQAAIAPDTRLVFLANPNNPTGTFLPAEALERFLQRVPSSVLVVLDEAYNEYLPPALRYDSVAWVRRYPNLLVSRTFSKIYGLASLRVGYAIARPEVAALLHRVRHPFNVNAFALAAATAALGDHEFVARSYELNRAGLEQLAAGFRRLGLEWVPSDANFLLVRVGDGARIYRGMLERGVIVRPVASYALPEWLRFTVGLPEENARALEALAAAVGTTSPAVR
ncbi:MAG TPA: histidinol-phosphate transaminase [Burkholderiaceae bacterium]|nr:histidinol-phosphate transaminase [Burkholderiaceae bacterium]